MSFQIGDISWDKTGNMFATAAYDGNISLFDGRTLLNEPLIVISPHTGPCNKLSFSDNFMVSCSSDSTCALFDLQELACVKSFSSNSNQVQIVSISQDEQLVAVLSEQAVEKEDQA